MSLAVRRRPIPQVVELESRFNPAAPAFVFDPVTHTLTFTPNGPPPDGQIQSVYITTISRDTSGRILIADISDNGAAPTDTGATVTTTDHIVFDMNSVSFGLTIDETQGLFAPGFTAQASGLSEIEFAANGGGSVG